MKMIVIALLLLTAAVKADFVKVKGAEFELGQKPYHYIGTNYWYGVNMGAPVSGDRDRVVRELDQLRYIGINNLRIMAGGQGPDDREKRIVPSIEPSPNVYNQDVWEGFDFLMDEMRKRGMKAIVPINNYWEWSGGFGQYVEWNGGDFNDPYSFYTMPEAQKQYFNFISYMLNRNNTINGYLYKNDDTIMAWQLSNEPRTKDCEQYKDWIKTTAQYIKSIAPYHLVSLGNEGTITPCAEEGNSIKELDYVTFHCWAQNWGWYDPSDPSTLDAALVKVDEYITKNTDIAKAVNKPAVLEEFGIARDGASYDPISTTHIRDKYYQFIFDYLLASIRSKKNNLVAVNFWAYGGYGRPSENGGWWKPGDDFIGDPPHERQGWYSVYDKDTTLTLAEMSIKKLSIFTTYLAKLQQNKR